MHAFCVKTFYFISSSTFLYIHSLTISAKIDTRLYFLTELALYIEISYKNVFFVQKFQVPHHREGIHRYTNEQEESIYIVACYNAEIIQFFRRKEAIKALKGFKSQRVDIRHAMPSWQHSRRNTSNRINQQHEQKSKTIQTKMLLFINSTCNKKECLQIKCKNAIQAFLCSRFVARLVMNKDNGTRDMICFIYLSCFLHWPNVGVRFFIYLYQSTVVCEGLMTI